MTDRDAVAMSDDERDAFLGDGGTGVLSLAGGDDPPHAVPVSYGYDAESGSFFFRLATGPDSQKGELEGRAVTFVAYGSEDDGTWRSVVARGRLEGTTDAGVGAEALAELERVHLPLVDIFGRPPTEVSFEFHRLAPERLTARKATSTAE
jgi:hypothetical protein